MHYDYGTTGNDKGRVVFQSDASGSQSFSYGNMGEMITNTRKIVGPNIPTRTFTTSFGYDSWNRLDYMVYPDGEKVAYGYDLGGNLNKISGDSNGVTTYIQRIDYDYFEQRTYLLYGNNTETTYKYTQKLRRLENLNVKTADHQNLFDNNYTYDKVGNVLKISNQATYTTNGLGGFYQHDFTYDPMNRLFTASGSFAGNPSQIGNSNDAQADYNLTMEYNQTNGIFRKGQQHNKNFGPVTANTYGNQYSYYPNTHQLKSTNDTNTGTSESYIYDFNGNMTKKTYANMHTRDFLWDESNRLRIVSENTSMQHYIYDASGERVLKTNSEIESVYTNGSLVTPSALTINSYTTYPSAFMVIDPTGIYTKHYYAGSQRIVSQIGDKSISMFEAKQLKTASPASGQTDDEKLRQLQITDLKQLLSQTSQSTVSFKEYKQVTYEEAENEIREEVAEDDQLVQASAAAVVKPIYYYHPDHLGTSTFLTDAMGNAYQFFLNLPFGETMAEQLPASYYTTPYKFNGKELDQETGLYYYGARYYDPKSSIWLSVDPIAEKYPNISPYIYCFDSPINFIDPDGRAAFGPEPPGKGWNRFMGVLKLVGGTFEAAAGTAGGVATSWTGIGAVVGGVVALHGTDIAGTGLKQIWTGEDESSLTSQAIQSVGISKSNADSIDASISIVGTGISGNISASAKALPVSVTRSAGAFKGGSWVTTNENMSAAAAEYQEYITGRSANQSFKLNGVKFDGVLKNVLVDAKSGYGNFVNKSGEFFGWFKGGNALVDQARRQLAASEGAKIQWYFQNKAVMEATKTLFEQKALKGIQLIYKP